MRIQLQERDTIWLPVAPSGECSVWQFVFDSFSSYALTLAAVTVVIGLISWLLFLTVMCLHTRFHTLLVCVLLSRFLYLPVRIISILFSYHWMLLICVILKQKWIKSPASHVNEIVRQAGTQGGYCKHPYCRLRQSVCQWRHLSTVRVMQTIIITCLLHGWTSPTCQKILRYVSDLKVVSEAVVSGEVHAWSWEGAM